MEEEFVDIKDYEGLYQINRLGVVKSLERYDSLGRLNYGKIKNLRNNNHGYLSVDLYKNNIKKTKILHQLLYITFISEYDTNYFDIDHINRIRIDNKLENLRLVSRRNNMNNMSNQSKFGCGVLFHKSKNKYQTLILINKKRINLGYFSIQEQASEKYQSIKSQIEEIEKITRSYSFTRTKINGEYFLDFFPV